MWRNTQTFGNVLLEFVHLVLQHVFYMEVTSILFIHIHPENTDSQQKCDSSLSEQKAHILQRSTVIYFSMYSIQASRQWNIGKSATAFNLGLF